MGFLIPCILYLVSFMSMNYFVKTPWWLKKLFPKRVWEMDTGRKMIYLTFDDGPHPVATPFVLEQLKKHEAKATFFCIGKNVQAYPDIYQRILEEGHQPGNHTQDHLNGWKTDSAVYLENIQQAGKLIKSSLFRPPYGRISSAQARQMKDYKVVMWTVLSGDFDTSSSKEKCLSNVLSQVSEGSIIVFHDSEKAWERMSFVLPVILEHFSKKGYEFGVIS
jgi:peptidoglycan-N-acetylglucosamine deacetylase